MILYQKCKDLLGLFQKKGAHRLNVLDCPPPPQIEIGDDPQTEIADADLK